MGTGVRVVGVGVVVIVVGGGGNGGIRMGTGHGARGTASASASASAAATGAVATATVRLRWRLRQPALPFTNVKVRVSIETLSPPYARTNPLRFRLGLKKLMQMVLGRSDTGGEGLTERCWACDARIPDPRIHLSQCEKRVALVSWKRALGRPWSMHVHLCTMTGGTDARGCPSPACLQRSWWSRPPDFVVWPDRQVPAHIDGQA